MKNILSVIFLLTFCSVYPQQPEDELFFSKIRKLEIPFVIDDITIDDNLKKQEVDYYKISKYLVSKNKEQSITVSDTNSNRFCIVGKFYIEEKPCLLILHKIRNSFEENNIVYLLVYSQKLELLGFDPIAWRATKGDLISKKASIINTNMYITFNKSSVDTIEEININKYNSLKEFPFDRDFCSQDSICLNFRAKFDSLCDRKISEYIFDDIFFNSNYYLIPLKYCSHYEYSQILSSIDGEKKLSMSSYFIDSKKIENNRTILFFLNKFVYKNYNIVNEVGYQIFNKKGTLEKSEQIALYHVDKKGVKSILSARIKIENKVLTIESENNGFEKRVERFKLETP